MYVIIHYFVYTYTYIFYIYTRIFKMSVVRSVDNYVHTCVAIDPANIYH